MTDSLPFLDLHEALKLEPRNDAVISELAKLEGPASNSKADVVQLPTSPAASSSVRGSLAVRCTFVISNTTLRHQSGSARP